jgi:hypothetical protein
MAEDQDMARVKIHRQVVIVPNQTSTVVYPEGFEGAAPREHIDQIVAGGHGVAVGQGQAPNKQVAENQDAFKSGSDNASV